MDTMDRSCGAPRSSSRRSTEHRRGTYGTAWWQLPLTVMSLRALHHRGCCLHVAAGAPTVQPSTLNSPLTWCTARRSPFPPSPTFGVEEPPLGDLRALGGAAGYHGHLLIAPCARHVGAFLAAAGGPARGGGGGALDHLGGSGGGAMTKYWTTYLIPL